MAGNCCVSISQAKGCLESSSPNCFIIDLKLPDGDGSEFIHYLRSKYEAPIIAISGGCSFFSLAFLEAANKLGAAYRLAKPFQGEQLIELINKCFN